MGRPIHIREWEDALYAKAEATVQRAPDRSMSEVDLENAIAALIEIDVEKERRKRAKEVLANRSRPGATEPEGQLMLPGLDEYDWEPKRLVRDDAGHVVENCNALIAFKAAESKRAREHARDAQVQADRKSEETERFAAWATQQALKGRPALDLTWGNCVNENGFLKAA
jgi:hypothetical protein